MSKTRLEKAASMAYRSSSSKPISNYDPGRVITTEKLYQETAQLHNQLRHLSKQVYTLTVDNTITITAVLLMIGGLIFELAAKFFVPVEAVVLQGFCLGGSFSFFLIPAVFFIAFFLSKLIQPKTIKIVLCALCMLNAGLALFNLFTIMT